MYIKELRKYLDIDGICTDLENLISAAQKENVRGDLIEAFSDFRDSLGTLSTSKGTTDDDYVHELILDCLKATPLIKNIAQTQNLPPNVFEHCKVTHRDLHRLVTGINERINIQTERAAV